jgi:capsule synthesis protein PGA_cap
MVSPASRRRALVALASVATVGGAATAAVTDGEPRSPQSEPRLGETGARAPRQAPTAQPTFTVTWVGDISLSRRYGLPPDGGRSLFASVRRDLRSTDLAIGNLEGTLGSGGASKCQAGAKNCFAFQAPSFYARVYRRAGFDVMNLANNHALDFGSFGQRQTITALRRNRIAYTGRPREILVRKVGQTRVALLGFAPYPWAASLRDIPGARRLVRRADRRADVVIVLMHAGAEGADKVHTPRGTEVAFGENRGDTRAFAHGVVGAGADLVLGSGPHVVRGIERYRGRLIAYSLGNFLGYRTFSTGGVLSLSGLLGVRVSDRGVPLGGRWHSIRLTGAGVPRRDRSRRSARFVRTLSRQDFGRRAYPMSRTGKLRSAR